MNNLCIFCKNELTNPSKEHIVPDAILMNSDVDITTNDVCITCNSFFGHSIDNEFLNDDFIKAIRLIHRDFIKSSVNPEISIKNFTNVTINNEIYFLDLLSNKTGNHLLFSNKPIFKDNILSVFIKENEVEKYLNQIKMNKKIKKINISNYKIKPVTNFDLQHVLINKINSGIISVPFPRFFIKMAIEFICKMFGKEVVLDNKFDQCRDVVLKKSDTYDCMCGFGIKIRHPYEPEKMNSVSHELSIKFDNNIKKWAFYFSFFNIIDYYLTIPEDNSYKECHVIINNFKNTAQSST